MTHKVSVSSSSYNVQQKSPNKFKVSTILGVSEVSNLSDLQDVDITGLEDGYVLIYDGTSQKYKAVNPDEVLSGALEGGLPNDLINALDAELDDKIDLDGGGF